MSDYLVYIRDALMRRRGELYRDLADIECKIREIDQLLVRAKE